MAVNWHGSSNGNLKPGTLITLDTPNNAHGRNKPIKGEAVSAQMANGSKTNGHVEDVDDGGFLVDFGIQGYRYLSPAPFDHPSKGRNVKPGVPCTEWLISDA